MRDAPSPDTFRRPYADIDAIHLEVGYTTSAFRASCRGTRIITASLGHAPQVFR